MYVETEQNGYYVAENQVKRTPLQDYRQYRKWGYRPQTALMSVLALHCHSAEEKDARIQRYANWRNRNV